MVLQMLSHSPSLDSTSSALISRLSPSFSASSAPSRGYNRRRIFFTPLSYSYSALKFSAISRGIKTMTRNFVLSNHTGTSDLQLSDSELDLFVDVGNQLADASGEVIRKYFRKTFDILDKDDLSPVTIADRMAEDSMVKIIQENFPTHAIFGEENGWRCKEKTPEYVWVLDPIDGTKSFITGKPLFGTLISLLYKGEPILGIVDQPVLRERWLGLHGRKTTLNGREICTRSCSDLSRAYLYTTSPHLFNGDAEVAFSRVRDKVKVPLYGCDCYAYALLASGFVDLVIESGLKPYDFLALIPVIQGAGGIITDWKGHKLNWDASLGSPATSFNVAAAGDKHVHKQALDLLKWP